jgi:nitrate reductase gamma subunit/ferredoxin
MSIRIDTSLLADLKAFGATNIESCFNCGNCTAVCPLTENASFPRKIIRYAQIGAKQALLGAKELWLCYYCGECSKTCPREAEPGEFMAAARRYAIAGFDPTGLAKAMYKRPWLNVLLSIVLALFFGVFLLAFTQGTGFAKLSFWQFLPEGVVKYGGLALFLAILVIMLVGCARMVRSLSWSARHQPASTAYSGEGKMGWLKAAWEALGIQALGHTSYRDDDCEEERGRPWIVRKWFMHAAIFYGFLGLFASTALDFLFKPLGSMVPIYYPMRLLGTISGIALMYGTSLALVRRFRKSDKYAANSHSSDWIFLVLIWLVGLTGFLLEISVYAPPPARWGYPLLIIHVALAMDLFALLPVSKFAHMLYRSTAIFLHHLKQKEKTEQEQTAVAPA